MEENLQPNDLSISRRSIMASANGSAIAFFLFWSLFFATSSADYTD